MCGISTPYRAQVRIYRRALNRLHMDMPDKKFCDVVVGTTEFWQGKHMEFTFVDFVRGANENGSLGFLADQRRANVLITRQKVALFLIADLDCVTRSDAAGMTEGKENAAPFAPGGNNQASKESGAARGCSGGRCGWIKYYVVKQCGYHGHIRLVLQA